MISDKWIQCREKLLENFGYKRDQRNRVMHYKTGLCITRFSAIYNYPSLQNPVKSTIYYNQSSKIVHKVLHKYVLNEYILEYLTSFPLENHSQPHGFAIFLLEMVGYKMHSIIHNEL